MKALTHFGKCEIVEKSKVLEDEELMYIGTCEYCKIVGQSGWYEFDIFESQDGRLVATRL